MTEVELWHAMDDAGRATLVRRGDAIVLRTGIVAEASEHDVELSDGQLENLQRVLGAVTRARALGRIREDG
jgi:hypothetical protein